MQRLQQVGDAGALRIEVFPGVDVRRPLRQFDFHGCLFQICRKGSAQVGEEVLVGHVVSLVVSVCRQPRLAVPGWRKRLVGASRCGCGFGDLQVALAFFECPLLELDGRL